MIKKSIFFSILFFLVASCQDSYSSKKCLGNNYEKWTDCSSEYTWKNGTNYSGEWVNGKASGLGKMEWYWGDIYIGEFKNGKPSGHGTMTWSNLQKKLELRKMDMELLIGLVDLNMLVSGKTVKPLVMVFILGQTEKNLLVTI